MNPLSIECDVHFNTRGRGRKGLEAGRHRRQPSPVAYLGRPACWRWRTAWTLCCAQAWSATMRSWPGWDT